jgi:hypothetical protein
MQKYGSHRRLCISGWILLALILITLNVFKLFEFEGQPWAGDTQEVRGLRQKLGHVQPVTPKPATNLDEVVIDSVPLESTTSPVHLDAGVVTASLQGSGSEDAGTLSLPILTGIIQIQDMQSMPSFRAVLDGQAYEKSERVREFRVGSISRQGVTLLHSRGNTFLSNPDPHFSSDQGK